VYAAETHVDVERKTPVDTVALLQSSHRKEAVSHTCTIPITSDNATTKNDDETLRIEEPVEIANEPDGARTPLTSRRCEPAVRSSLIREIPATGPAGGGSLVETAPL